MDIKNTAGVEAQTEPIRCQICGVTIDASDALQAIAHAIGKQLVREHDERLQVYVSAVLEIAPWLDRKDVYGTIYDSFMDGFLED